MTNTGRPAAPPMTNPRADRVKEVARLAGRPARLRQGRFLAEGPQSVREALALHSARHAAGEPEVIEELFITEECLDRHAELGLFEGQPAPRLVTEEVLAAMSSTVTPQGVIAVCSFVDVPLEAMLAREPRLVAVMVEVRDPGNAGTILRAADSAGADAVVLTSSSVDLYNPKAVRSTVGSLFHLPVVLGADLDLVLTSLRERGITVLAADGYGDVDLDTLQEGSARRRLAPSAENAGDGSSAARLEAPTAWLFGNEAQGLPDVVLKGADHRVAVPIYGRAESLNVGTAATVCLYASARAQRLS
ncbi:RNA methyltransferase [Arthrobacter sp. Bz4]|uniref:TrmH family RNA methyltransferase n=1 Tax=Arthrobacter sp. Bz4 TaxID=2171979 RepID=UPI000D518554|nr:RNA methyltransferase [Arthrobacter sp. Bz4]PVE17335.1 RNA methyltransferase [Arthrobacter sp. Bz4]